MGLDALEDFMRKGICLNFQGDLTFLLLPCALESEKGQFEGDRLPQRPNFAVAGFQIFNLALKFGLYILGQFCTKNVHLLTKYV